MAVTRHMRLEESTTADSMVVFESGTFVRLSHEQTGMIPGKIGMGSGSAARVPTSALAMRVTTRI